MSYTSVNDINGCIPVPILMIILILFVDSHNNVIISSAVYCHDTLPTELWLSPAEAVTFLRRGCNRRSQQ